MVGAIGGVASIWIGKRVYRQLGIPRLERSIRPRSVVYDKRLGEIDPSADSTVDINPGHAEQTPPITRDDDGGITLSVAQGDGVRRKRDQTIRDRQFDDDFADSDPEICHDNDNEDHVNGYSDEKGHSSRLE